MNDLEYHHVGIAVANLVEAANRFKALLGYEIVSGPFDDPIQKVSVCFLSRGSGDPWLELVAPLGEKSPIDRLLARGGGAYHVCYQARDINAAISHLVSEGSYLISGPTPAVAFDLRPIAWLRTSPGLIVELVQAPNS
jgi:methylmalonyl-CoA/ethylmalonyl-CoA epimerase